VFGNTSGTPASARGHPNIAFLGKVSDEKLVNLYSNALYTLFAFAHEPFGYIPVESMACGTPVLTYSKQGPLETVIDEKTGWLADSNKKMLVLGLNHWKKGYGNEFRTACRERALMFDTERILKQWNSIMGKSDRND
jgi:glycosyltransferase involved in cell wall biosynthesis